MIRIKKVITNEVALKVFINSYSYNNVGEFACVDHNSNIEGDSNGSLHYSLKELIADAVNGYNKFYTTNVVECYITLDNDLMTIETIGPMKPEYEAKQEDDYNDIEDSVF